MNSIFSAPDIAGIEATVMGRFRSSRLPAPAINRNLPAIQKLKPNIKAREYNDLVKSGWSTAKIKSFQSSRDRVYENEAVKQHFNSQLKTARLPREQKRKWSGHYVSMSGLGQLPEWQAYLTEVENMIKTRESQRQPYLAERQRIHNIAFSRKGRHRGRFTDDEKRQARIAYEKLLPIQEELEQLYPLRAEALNKIKTMQGQVGLGQTTEWVAVVAGKAAGAMVNAPKSPAPILPLLGLGIGIYLIFKD